MAMKRHGPPKTGFAHRKHGTLSITHAPRNVTAAENSDVTLFCNATSVFHVMPLPASITWVKLNDANVTLPEGKSLVLRGVTRRDRGMYECQARNGIARMESATAYVDVKCEYSNLRDRTMENQELGEKIKQRVVTVLTQV
ncbi:predicted protein [Nematostella vectensis]|uniref:Ig-like domain-containing protein n=1 Tax=Nematostella vectensis TaxID=45351 RepID=A7RYF7_NEMVE|nr:predicted protein [Nematostella vectensis]|eukprot:XP_001635516.1 predicted protein [Nematostella vectensis]